MTKLVWTAWLLTALATAGCGSGRPGIAREVDVGLGRDVGQTSVTVHLVGVGGDEIAWWRDADLDQYWDPASAESGVLTEAARQGRLRVIELGGGGRRRVVVDPEDAIFDRWAERGVKSLVVLTDLPNEIPGPPQAGEADPRRQIFALDPRSRRAAGEVITLRVGPGGFVTLSR